MTCERGTGRNEVRHVAPPARHPRLNVKSGRCLREGFLNGSNFEYATPVSKL